MRSALVTYDSRLFYFHHEFLEVLDRLKTCFHIKALYSHEETGLAATFRRDQEVAHWCSQNEVCWQEFRRDGLRRGARRRSGWQQQWEQFMNASCEQPPLERLNSVEVPADCIKELDKPLPTAFVTSNPTFQKGGPTEATKLLDSFLSERCQRYIAHISRPAESRWSCSRLSPFMAHGNISARQVYQAAKKLKDSHPHNPHQQMNEFLSRIWWRCHYMQKLETDYEIEYSHINSGFNGLEKPFRADYYAAWSQGQTGFPMVDASMRCLISTGYLNFRMRAMLATFWSFTLWQDWRKGAEWLAKVFLDFEPGIHYPQFQMQAGMTGYHPMRIFSPIAQTEKYDPDGKFIYQWVPELRSVPAHLLARPWEIPPLEQQFYGIQIGTDYPGPIVDYQKATKAAKERYWEFRKGADVRNRLPDVWRRFSLPQDILGYQKELFAGKEIVVTESLMYQPEW
ncbi:MAG: FAD-binding domain-containing protein [Bacteroidota bacterium]